MHVATTFLGGGPNRQYRPARYAFSRTEIYDTQLFGWALVQHLHNAGQPADKLVVFGTPTSFWEHLFRVACPENTAEIAALAAQAQRGVTRRELQAYQDTLSQAAAAWNVQEVKLELIDFLEKTDEQLRFISQLASLLNPGDSLTLDITHGLRHQPILCTVAAMVLRAARHAGIADIYYGALELTPRGEGAETPVLRLNPLLGLADWIAAMAEADATGDYGGVAALLRKDGIGDKTCDALADGFFLHAIGNFESAADKFADWRTGIGSSAPRGASEIFVNEINRRIEFVLGAASKQDRLVAAAKDALARGLVIRAAEIGYEAAIGLLAQHGFVDTRELSAAQVYDAAFKKWLGRTPGSKHQHPRLLWKAAFDRVRLMRNRMAHLDFGDPSAAGRAEEALRSRTAAEQALSEDFGNLFGLDPMDAIHL